MAAPIELIGDTYNLVAASQTAQVMVGTKPGYFTGKGAVGDTITRVVIIPATTAPGVVTVIDGSTNILAWPGGTVSAALQPFSIELNMKSVSGAWKITTGGNVSVIGIGQFS